jgi:hypothetical protein
MASWATMSAPMTSLAQMARVVLDTVKFLDRGELRDEFRGQSPVAG